MTVMKKHRKKIKKTNGLKRIFDNPIVYKLISYTLVAFVAYIINTIQTSGEINQLKKDNVDLSWGVDYFRSP